MQPRPADNFCIDRLLKRGHNATLAATYKAGKTSLACELARCLVDSAPFLGRFETDIERNVGCLNAEMEEYDWLDYMAPLGIEAAARVRAWHFRGYRLDLLTDAGAEAAVCWLQENEVDLWMIDSWARLCAWSGIDENHNSEVMPLLSRLDEIKVQAGVGELLVIAHMGRADQEAGAERVRGATVLDDWVDARWVLTKDSETQARFLTVEGRGVSLGESELARDLLGRLALVGGSRAESKASRSVDEVVAIVTAQPGLKTGDVKDLMTTTSRAPVQSKAVNLAVAQGLIWVEKAGNAKLLHPVSKDGQ